MEAGWFSKSARAPSEIPSRGPSGITRARPSRKPTTSQEIFFPFPRVRRAWPPRLTAPTAPVTSTAKPSMRATRPNRVSIGRASTSLSKARISKPLDRFFLAFRPHCEAKDLNGGKLNKSNQGIMWAVDNQHVLIRDCGPLKVEREVKGGVNHYRLPSGNCLTVPTGATRDEEGLTCAYF